MDLKALHQEISKLSDEDRESAGQNIQALSSEENFLRWLKTIDYFCHGQSIDLEKNKSLGWKFIVYQFSLLYNVLWHLFDKNKTGWWSHISDRIILGALPLYSQKARLRKKNISLVISLTLPFERERFLFHPINQMDWQKEGVENLLLPNADFGKVSLMDLYRGASALHKAVQEGKTSYVHCKAGKSRSAAVVIAYYSTFGGMKLDEAIEFVRSKRPIIAIEDKRSQLIAYYECFHAFFKNDG